MSQPNGNILQDIIQWDVKAWSKAIEFWQSQVKWNAVQSALELGGRQGGLSLWLALKGINVVCSDLEDTESIAKPLHHKYGINQLVTYRDIDATEIPYENHFDIILFKSILGGIGRNNQPEKQLKAIAGIYKALKPGGMLLFAENLMASTVHQQLRKKFINWGSSWRYVSLSEMENYLSCFSEFKIKSTGVLSAFGRSEKQRNFLASIDSFSFNKFAPKSWNYITYGIARK